MDLVDVLVQLVYAAQVGQDHNSVSHHGRVVALPLATRQVDGEPSDKHCGDEDVERDVLGRDQRADGGHQHLGLIKVKHEMVLFERELARLLGQQVHDGEGQGDEQDAEDARSVDYLLVSHVFNQLDVVGGLVNSEYLVEVADGAALAHQVEQRHVQVEELGQQHGDGLVLGQRLDNLLHQRVQVPEL